jgi:carbonic anhydrase/acetyltransferase-like protein (isoleucine patch superfamily)
MLVMTRGLGGWIITVSLSVLSVAFEAQAVTIWGVTYSRDAPYTTSNQLIRFDSSSPDNVTVVGDTGTAGNLFFRGLDFDRSRNLYGYANYEDGGTITAQGLYHLDVATGQATFIGSGGVDSGGYISDLAYDSVTDTMYGIGNTGTAQNTLTQLYSLDLTTGMATKIGNVIPPGPFLIPSGLATDAGGTTYILDTLREEIDVLQGLVANSLPNPLGFNPYGIYGMTIDWSGDGTWYIAGQLNYFPPPPEVRSRSEFRTVDSATGISTLVGTIGATGDEYGGPSDIAIMPLIIDDTATVAPDAEIGSGSRVGANTVIQKGVKIGIASDIGANVTINKDTQLGNYAVIGDGSTIHKDVTAGDNLTVGVNVTIHKGVMIGTDVTIGDNTEIHTGTVIGNNATIGMLNGGVGVFIGNRVTIAAGSVVGDGEVIPNDTAYP